jgi:hypothetical protein
MKKIAVMMIVVAVIFILGADDQNDSLWQKASALARDNSNWVAGEVEISVSALDDTNSEMMRASLLFSYELEDGQIIGYYEGGTRSGELIPEHDQMVQEILKQDMKPDDSSLFYNNEDWELEVKRRDINEKKLKKQCAVYDFTCQQPTDDGKKIPVKGTVWIDLESGAPVYNEHIMAPPVEMVEEIINKITYNCKNGDFTIKTMESVTAVNAMGHKARMKNNMVFKDYWRFEE